MRFPVSAAAVLILALVAPRAVAEDGDLALRRSALLLRAPRGERAPNHRVALRAGFPVEAFLDTFDPALHAVAIRIGPSTVFELEPAAGHLRQPGRYLWRYRGPRAGRRRGPMLRLDVALRSVTLRARGLDLRALQAAGPTDVEVALVLGEREFTTHVDFRVRRFRWTYRPGFEPFVPGTRPPPNGGGNGGSPGTTPTPSDGRVTWTSLAQGGHSGIQGAETRVVRTQQEWTALWARHQAGTTGGPAAPRVDFTADMVLAVFVGTRASGGYLAAIESVTRSGDDLAVNWSETRPGANCIVTTALSQPHVIVRVPRATGRVAFQGRAFSKNCP